MQANIYYVDYYCKLTKETAFEYLMYTSRFQEYTSRSIDIIKRFLKEWWCENMYICCYKNKFDILDMKQIIWWNERDMKYIIDKYAMSGFMSAIKKKKHYYTLEPLDWYRIVSIDWAEYYSEYNSDYEYIEEDVYKDIWKTPISINPIAIDKIFFQAIAI